MVLPGGRGGEELRMKGTILSPTPILTSSSKGRFHGMPWLVSGMDTMERDKGNNSPSKVKGNEIFNHSSQKISRRSPISQIIAAHYIPLGFAITVRIAHKHNFRKSVTSGAGMRERDGESCQIHHKKKPGIAKAHWVLLSSLPQSHPPTWSVG